MAPRKISFPKNCGSASADQVRYERHRLLQAQAEAQVMKNLILVGEFVPLAKVREVMVDRALRMRNAVLGLPARLIEACPDMPTPARAALDKACKLMLEELASQPIIEPRPITEKVLKPNAPFKGRMALAVFKGGRKT